VALGKIPANYSHPTSGEAAGRRAAARRALIIEAAIFWGFRRAWASSGPPRASPRGIGLPVDADGTWRPPFRSSTLCSRMAGSESAWRRARRPFDRQSAPDARQSGRSQASDRRDSGPPMHARRAPPRKGDGVARGLLGSGSRKTSSNAPADSILVYSAAITGAAVGSNFSPWRPCARIPAPSWITPSFV